jgi:hypothetical protein
MVTNSSTATSTTRRGFVAGEEKNPNSEAEIVKNRSKNKRETSK